VFNDFSKVNLPSCATITKYQFENIPVTTPPKDPLSLFVLNPILNTQLQETVSIFGIY
jgi:hypothetical protein